MWQDLYIKSGELIGPYLADDLPIFPLSFDHISSALDGARRHEGEAKLNYFRGYVRGKEDYRLAERFLSYDLSIQGIEQSIVDAFGGENPDLGKNAGLIVNGSLQWSDHLQEDLGPDATQLASLFPGEQITVDITLFIGAYGSTPFGAHIDDASHRTILFNLGPGEKGMALWQNDAVRKQFGRVRNILDPASINSVPKEYFFKLGEAFVLPSEQFHVGLNSTLSTTIAVVVDIVSDGKAAAREAQNIGFFFNALEQTKKHDVRNINFGDLVKFNGLRNSSNHHLRYSPAKKMFNASKMSTQTLLKPTQNTGIKVVPLDSTTIIYSRGYHHIFDSSLEESVFEPLLQESTYDVDFFLYSLSSSTAPLKSKVALLKFLIETRSLEVLK